MQVAAFGHLAEKNQQLIGIVADTLKVALGARTIRGVPGVG